MVHWERERPRDLAEHILGPQRFNLRGRTRAVERWLRDDDAQGLLAVDDELQIAFALEDEAELKKVFKDDTGCR